MADYNLPFDELDFDAVDFDDGHWSFGCSGTGFRLTINQFFISYTDEDLNETIYILPKCLNWIIAHEKATSEGHLLVKYTKF